MRTADTVHGAPLRQRVHLGPVDLPVTSRRRLAEMGLRPGAVLEVVHRTVGGGRVVAVGGGRIALDSATARRIHVTPAEEGQA